MPVAEDDWPHAAGASATNTAKIKLQKCHDEQGSILLERKILVFMVWPDESWVDCGLDSDLKRILRRLSKRNTTGVKGFLGFLHLVFSPTNCQNI